MKSNWNLDCGKEDCGWFDNGKGYEECKFCTRFSRGVGTGHSSLRATDRYSPLSAPLQAEEGKKNEKTILEKALAYWVKYYRAENAELIDLLKRYRAIFHCPYGECGKRVCHSDCQLCWDIAKKLSDIEEGDA